MNGGFTKWAVGIFTVIIIAFGGWVFSSVHDTQLQAAVLRAEVTRLQLDLLDFKEQLQRIEDKQDFIIQNLRKNNGLD